MEGAIGVEKIQLSKDDLSISFYRFEEFLKTLKFQIRNKCECYTSATFRFQPTDLLLEPNPQGGGNKSKESFFMKTQETLATPSAKSINVIELSSNEFPSIKSPYSLAHSPMCRSWICM